MQCQSMDTKKINETNTTEFSCNIFNTSLKDEKEILNLMKQIKKSEKNNPLEDKKIIEIKEGRFTTLSKDRNKVGILQTSINDDKKNKLSAGVERSIPPVIQGEQYEKSCPINLTYTHSNGKRTSLIVNLTLNKSANVKGTTPSTQAEFSCNFFNDFLKNQKMISKFIEKVTIKQNRKAENKLKINQRIFTIIKTDRDELEKLKSIINEDKGTLSAVAIKSIPPVIQGLFYEKSCPITLTYSKPTGEKNSIEIILTKTKTEADMFRPVVNFNNPPQ